jgi:molybdenum cofactor synthesis domain-containing protein
MSDSTMVTAAVCVIGNEILSGRTQDANIAFLGRGLNEIGVQLREVRVVPDIREEIVAAVNALRARYDYVFTTGGIGPTHDDITAESIGAAFDRQVDYHPVAYARMDAYYRETGREFTEARKRMALMPEGAELIENEATIAPGFRVENVFVLAGVPQIARAMFEAAKPALRRGRTVLSRSISTKLVEGVLAQGLGEIQDRHPRADIGSYPFYDGPGGHGVTLVVRSTEPADLESAGDQILALIAGLGGEALGDERG